MRSKKWTESSWKASVLAWNSLDLPAKLVAAGEGEFRDSALQLQGARPTDDRSELDRHSGPIID